LGLLAETYAEIAATHADFIYLIRSPDCDATRPAKDVAKAKEHLDKSSEFSQKAETFAAAHPRQMSPEILEDVAWRRHNALGIAESSFACFDARNQYDVHCDNALVHYRDALQRSPLNFNVLENMGEVYRDRLYSKHSLDEAEKLFLQSQELKPEDVYAPQQLGKIYDIRWQTSGKKDSEAKRKMVDSFTRAAALGSADAKMRLEELEKAGVTKRGKVR
jgi:tetratricopeptide (TPR) repeat protein